MVDRPHPQYGWDFPEEIPEKIRKDPGNTLRAFPGIPLKSTAHFKASEASRAFPDSFPPSFAGGASFFRSGSGEGLSELVMEFLAVLRVFLTRETIALFLLFRGSSSIAIVRVKGRPNTFQAWLPWQVLQSHPLPISPLLQTPNLGTGRPSCHRPNSTR